MRRPFLAALLAVVLPATEGGGCAERIRKYEAEGASAPEVYRFGETDEVARHCSAGNRFVCGYRSSRCLGLGDQGHKVICEIAFRLAQPSTRAEIQKLISNDERFDSFSDSCTWPDHPRQRASEHFLNLPRDSDGLDSETCPGASARIVTAIKKDFEVLSSNNASQARKLASLKFLGHWVGDIHQPVGSKN